MPSPVYKRAPSEELKALLSPGGGLKSLVDINKQEVNRTELDVHFRPGDEIQVYCGRTRVLKAKRLQRPKGYVKVEASYTYTKQPCAKGLFRRWHIDEPGFREAIDHYLNDVKVGPSWILGEGKVQEQWSQVNVPWMPWIPFDREGVLGGPHPVGMDYPQVLAAFDQLTELSRRDGWDTLEATGREIDQLAVDSKGQLVLLELKDGSKSEAKVYYSPFQLLQYVWEWDTALKDVRNDLQEVIDARVAVKLTPWDVPKLAGGIRPAVGFGLDAPRGETRLNYERVLDVVNKHLPCGVKPIETWAFTNAGPTRLAI